MGLGFRKNIKNDGLALLGFKCGYGTMTYNPIETIVEREGREVISREKKEIMETTDTSMSCTVLAGVEYPITRWLTARGGVSMKIAALTDEVAVEDYTKNLKMGVEDEVEELVREVKSKNVDTYYRYRANCCNHTP